MPRFSSRRSVVSAFPLFLLFLTTSCFTSLALAAPISLLLPGREAGSLMRESFGSETGLAAPARGSAGIAFSDRAALVRGVVDDRLSLIPHKRNYLLPAVFRLDGDSEPVDPDGEISDTEFEFQLSVQVPLWSGIVGEDSFVSLAYTNRSYWQAYTASAPVRESNHEPELLVTWLSDWSLWGFECVTTQMGISHQSNGRGDELSRSWNRIYSRFVFERDDYFVSFKPWYRIPEERDGDDNPHMDRYLGNFELDLGYRGDFFSTSVMVRNNLRSDNRGAVEMRLAFPLGGHISGYLRYFNGYGESLINYDRSIQSIGIGIELARGL